MKKLGGILALPVRALFFKVLTVTAATAAAQVAAVLLLPNAAQLDLAYLQLESYTHLLAAVGFAAVTALLALHGCQFSGVKTDYTLRRLPVAEERVVCLWALAYLGFLVLFWAVELGVVLFQWHVVTRQLTYRPAPLAAESYLNGFFHGLLPLEDWPRHIRNLLWLSALSLGLAVFSRWQRRGQVSLVWVLTLLLGLCTFCSSPGSAIIDLFFSIYLLGQILFQLDGLRESEADAHEEA
ncbi:MAG TPA: hypothetical protein IAA53_00080 [Candidatus Avoscillospira avicola]|uniref:Uncharacterized protein n=1 Tax=Candidatus Avoscillospira avicola TaxID=2840706 RepID=A0A9D1DG28_9FIRM|nr:hypothetical protein [Candidatus Avoscillospira avicola]